MLRRSLTHFGYLQRSYSGKGLLQMFQQQGRSENFLDAKILIAPPPRHLLVPGSAPSRKKRCCGILIDNFVVASKQLCKGVSFSCGTPTRHIYPQIVWQTGITVVCILRILFSNFEVNFRKKREADSESDESAGFEPYTFSVQWWRSRRRKRGRDL